MWMVGKYPTNTYRKLFLWTKQIVFLLANKILKVQYVIICDLKSYFFHILQFGEGDSSLFTNFGTLWAILEIQSAKLVRISPGLTKYPPIIHTCRYTDQKSVYRHQWSHCENNLFKSSPAGCNLNSWNARYHLNNYLAYYIQFGCLHI